MPGKGTRNAIFVLRRMSESAVEKQKDIICEWYHLANIEYACLIDYGKVFVTVRHEPLIDPCVHAILRFTVNPWSR